MIDKQADTQTPINTLMASRWSGRAYDSKKDVTHQQLLAIVEAARWAPSCFGDEPWRYIVCHKSANAPAWQNALDCLVEGNQQWAQHAPVLIVVLANTIFSTNDDENRWAQYDSGAASMSMCLQATELGLMAHQMGGILVENITQTFSVPTQFTPMAMMTIGYQLAKDEIPENMLERELAERQRKPLGERFYAGSWGESFI